jgi:hypothetical protein
MSHLQEWLDAGGWRARQGVRLRGMGVKESRLQLAQQPLIAGLLEDRRLYLQHVEVRLAPV